MVSIMSSSAISLAMIPVKNEITPILQVNQGGMTSSRNRYQAQDGIIFRGYLSDNKSNSTYGRSGRPKKNFQTAGEIVDLYI